MAKDLLQNILQTDPTKRYDIVQILSHPWCNLTKPKLDNGIIIGVDSILLDKAIIDIIVKDIEKYKGLRTNKTITLKELLTNLNENHHNCLTAT
jgi:hypothetical protein